MPPRDPNRIPARNLQGVFLDTATGAADELRVVVEDFGDQDTFGPVVWTPAFDGSFPQAGDRAWISEFRGDLRSEWVVVLWRPS